MVNVVVITEMAKSVAFKKINARDVLALIFRDITIRTVARGRESLIPRPVILVLPRFKSRIHQTELKFDQPRE
jgi:hypothetical protein